MTAIMRAVWKKIIHKDDATDEEKKILVEKVRNSPPIPPALALFQPPMVVQAHRMLKRYQGKTWVWPRLMQLGMLGFAGIPTWNYFSQLLKEPNSDERAFTLLLSIYVVLPTILFLSHLLTTVARMGETCVWCHIIQRGSDGEIVATLLISAYRLPFLDPSRSHPAPWQRTWWKSTVADVTLETTKDVRQLSYSDVYDETVCSVRRPTFVPASANQYAVGKMERHGDIAIRKRKRASLRLGPQAQTVAITATGVVISAIITIGATWWQLSGAG